MKTQFAFRTGAVAGCLLLSCVLMLAQQLAEAPFRVAFGAQAGAKVTVYDGSMEKCNGQYYLYGTGSAGKVYASSDLIHWDSPVLWLSPNGPDIPSWVGPDSVYARYGAGDIFFHNGVIFWCFNDIALAGFNPATLSGPSPVGSHYSTDHPYSRGIDGQFFISHQGELLYVRKVQPSEEDRGNGSGEAWVFELGNSIFNAPYGAERADPGFGYEILRGQKGRWDNLDHFNFEGPELFYRNGRYYMLYVGNKMDPETGLYETGVAQNSQWRSIGNSDKYPGKLIARNHEKFLLRSNVILPTGEYGGWDYKYTFSTPSVGWQALAFDDSAWNTGEGGFGWPVYLDGRVRRLGLWNAGKTDETNIWSSPTGPKQIWVRRSFQLDHVPEVPVLRHRLAGSGILYVNGTALLLPSEAPRSYSMTEIPRHYLRTGTNVIAVMMGALSSFEQNHLDFGVYDLRGKPPEPDIVGPSQPHLAEGPNGFELWALYKAFWNANHGQGKSRVYFWKNGEMVVDGPHSGSSADFPLEPSPPVFREDFNSATAFNRFDPANPYIYPDNNALFFDSNTAGFDFNQIFVTGFTAQNLFIEANIKFADDPGSIGRAGVVAWHLDADNYVRVYIERTSKRVFVPYRFNGVNGSASFALPASFDYTESDPRASSYGEQYHTLKVYKNGARLFAQLDHYWINNDQSLLIREEMLTPGRAGLAGFQTRHWIDNLTVSTGWEENGTNVNGWPGNWLVSTNGVCSPALGEQVAIKGSPMVHSEFSAHLDTTSLPTNGRAGLVISQADPANRITVSVNYANRMLELWALRAGIPQLLAASPASRDTILGYSNFSGISQSEYHFLLRGEAAVSRVRPLWLYGYNQHLNIDYKLPNFSLSSFGVDAWKAGAWQNCPLNYQNGGRGRFGDAVFLQEQVTTGVRLRVPSTINRPASFAVREEISSQNFIRTRRQAGRIYVWLNNRLVFDVVDPFPATPGSPGLFSHDCAIIFDYITCFEIPEQLSLPAVPNERKVPSPDETYLFGGPEGKPRLLMIEDQGKRHFALRFQRRHSDSSLRYQVRSGTRPDALDTILWTDADPAGSSSPLDTDFEEVLVFCGEVGARKSAFMQVIITRQ